MDKCSDSTGDSSDDEPLSTLTKKLKTDVLSDTTQSELNSRPDPRKASDDSTGDSSDDEPLSSLIKKSQTDDLSNTTQSELNSQSTSNKDGFNTSDDEPLKKMVRISLPVKTPGESKGNKRGSVRTEKTAAESSDDEPLIRHSKKPSAERTAPLPLKKRPVNRARKNSNMNQNRDKHADSTSDSSNDDKPLSNIVKSSKTQTQRKTPTSAARKSPRKAPNKLQRSGESWDSSDDEPLIRMTRRSPGRRGTLMTKRGRRANSNRRGNKLRKVEEDSDDEPLIRLVKKPTKKTRTPVKKTLVPEKTVVSRKKSVNRAVNRRKTDTAQITYHSSDDEPLIKLVKNPSNPGKKTRPARRAASVKIPNVAIKERSRRNIKPVQYTSKGSSNDDSSDDEPLITMVKKPLITKTPMLELERVEDAFDNYNRGSTSKICGGKEENPAGELLVKVITSPPEPLGDSVVEERGKREVNCDKEP